MQRIVYNSGMEFANTPNSSQGESRNLFSTPKFAVTHAQKADEKSVDQFINQAFFQHVHADWYDPLFWIGEPGAVTLLSQRDNRMIGCLIAAADPPPAAWVRAAAFDYLGLSRHQIKGQFIDLVAAAAAELSAAGVSQLCWMSPRRWAEPWLVDAGFRNHTTMITYRKENLQLPSLPASSPELKIRPVLPEDMRQLARIETAAYVPLWRHSARGLQRAWRSAFTFDVALWNGEVVGFQHTTRANRDDAHLARITIHPDYQGRGIGSHMLAHIIKRFQNQGVKYITLNTQAENVNAQQLYSRFGFRPTPYRWPLSILELEAKEDL